MGIDDKLQDLYALRFEGELSRKNAMWRALIGSFFQQYIKESDTVLDLGGGYCEFINNIKCGKKYVVDLNEDIVKFANPDVQPFNSRLSEIAPSLESSVDVVFMSNFLEHLKSKEEVLKTLSNVLSILKPDGTLIILQPNIRYAYKVYWDFFDHNIPLSDGSMVEALQLTGFKVSRLIPKFLPYTTKSKIPQNTFLVRAYLKMPLAWKICGKQMLVICHPDKKGGRPK